MSELTEKLQEQHETIQEQAKRIDELEEALVFYADPDTYFAMSFMVLSDVLNGDTGDAKVGMVMDPPCGEFAEDISLCGNRMRPGRLARQTMGVGCYILNNPDEEEDE